MQVPIVVDTPEGAKQVGIVDVYAHSWFTLPRDTQLDLDAALLSGQVEFLFRIKKSAQGESYVRTITLGEVEENSGSVKPFHPSEYLGEWSREPLSLAEEFEKLRKAGPKWSRSQYSRLRHVEEHLDRGDVVCRCYQEEVEDGTTPPSEGGG